MTHLSLPLRPLASTLAIGLCTFGLPLAAHADVLSFSFNNSISDLTASTIGNATGTLSGSSNITQFDANTGVLMGTSLQVTSTATQTINASGTNASTSKTSPTATVNGSGSADTFGFSALGVSTNFGKLSTATVSTGCSTSVNGGNCTAATVTDAGTAVNSGALAVASGNLNGYVGAGTVLGSYSANMTANATTSGAKFASVNATYGLTWAGNLQVTYDYLLHAAGSFGSGGSQLTLNLDFGTLYLGDVASLGFDIFNLAGNRVGLDLDSTNGSGDTSKLTLGSCAFTALAAGGNQHCSAGLDTSGVGTFGATYVFNLSDANVGASATWKTQQLTLNLRGVVATAQTVPEPASLALLGAGLAGLGFARRKRS